MKIPNWAKIIWWILLAGFFAYLLSQRYNSIISGAATPMDIVIFLILIALLAIPLFQEVSFFGVSLKKEFDNLKSEVKEQIINLRSDIQSTINMRTEISPHIYFPYPPPDSELSAIEKGIQTIIAQTSKERGIEKPTPTTAESLAPEDTLYLFSVRYALEKELGRILNARFAPLMPKGYIEAIDIINYLRDRGNITQPLHKAIREVYNICSIGIHGGEISEKSSEFVRKVSPGLLATLKSVEAINWQTDKTT